MVAALPLLFGRWEASAVVPLGKVGVDDAGQYRWVSPVALLVDGEPWGLEGSAEDFSEGGELVYVEAWGFEISASAVLVGVEAEDVEAWRLRAAFAVKPRVGEVFEDVEALHLEADFAVGLPVDMEIEDVELSHSESVAEHS